MAEPDEDQVLTDQALEIRGKHRSPSWFKRWVVDNLLRHVLAHLVGRGPAGDVHLRATAGGFVGVHALIGTEAPELATYFQTTYGAVESISYGAAAPRLVRITATGGPIRLYDGDTDHGLDRAIGCIQGGQEVLAYVTGAYLTADATQTATTYWVGMQSWLL